MAITMFDMLAGSIFIFFMLAYACFYFYDRSQKLAGVMALTFLVAIVAQGFDSMEPGIGGSLSGFIGLCLFWLSYIMVVCVYALRSGEPIPMARLAAIIFFAMPLFIFSSAYFPNSVVRLIIVEATAGAIIFCCIPILRRKLDSVVDHLLLWFNIAALTIIFARMVILAFDVNPAGWGEMREFYHAILLFTSVLVGIIGACLLFIALGVDMVAKAQTEALTDSLTGLHNRRGLSQKVDTFKRERGENALQGRAVLLFDIDRFKQINDEFGHDLGDEVLAKIGAMIRMLMEQHGYSARSGGEEFVMLFNRESSAAAFLISEHLRVAISMLKFEGMPEDRRVTVSMGLAFVRQGEPLKRTVRRADAALYVAKDDGRNKLRLAEGDTLPDAEDNKRVPAISNRSKE